MVWSIDKFKENINMLLKRNINKTVSKEEYRQYILLPYLSSMGYDPSNMWEVVLQSKLGNLEVNIHEDIQLTISMDGINSPQSTSSINQLHLGIDLLSQVYKFYIKSLDKWTLVYQFNMGDLETTEETASNYIGMMKYLVKDSILSEYEKKGNRVFSEGVVANLLQSQDFNNRFLQHIIQKEFNNPSHEFITLLVLRIKEEFSTEDTELLYSWLEPLMPIGILGIVDSVMSKLPTGTKKKTTENNPSIEEVLRNQQETALLHSVNHVDDIEDMGEVSNLINHLNELSHFEADDTEPMTIEPEYSLENSNEESLYTSDFEEENTEYTDTIDTPDVLQEDDITETNSLDEEYAVQEDYGVDGTYEEVQYEEESAPYEEDVDEPFDFIFEEEVEEEVEKEEGIDLTMMFAQNEEESHEQDIPLPTFGVEQDDEQEKAFDLGALFSGENTTTESVKAKPEKNTPSKSKGKGSGQGVDLGALFTGDTPPISENIVPTVKVDVPKKEIRPKQSPKTGTNSTGKEATNVVPTIKVDVPKQTRNPRTSTKATVPTVKVEKKTFNTANIQKKGEGVEVALGNVVSVKDVDKNLEFRENNKDMPIDESTGSTKKPMRKLSGTKVNTSNRLAEMRERLSQNNEE